MRRSAARPANGRGHPERSLQGTFLLRLCNACYVRTFVQYRPSCTYWFGVLSSSSRFVLFLRSAPAAAEVAMDCPVAGVGRFGTFLPTSAAQPGERGPGARRFETELDEEPRDP